MKKILFLVLVILLVLSACSSDVEEVSEGEVIEELDEVVVEVEMEETTDEDLVVVDEEPEPEPEVESLDPSDYLIEKRIGEYSFEEIKTGTKKILGYTFESMEAKYEFGKTKAVVSVLYSGDKKVNLYEFMNKTDLNDNYEFLDDEDVDFVDQDVYYNPYENTYLWVSGGRIILIEDSIGFDLLERYLEEFSVSVIHGTFENEEVEVEFDGEDDQKIIFLNDNQYVLELVDLDKTNNEVTLSVNEERKVFDVSDKGVIGGLMIEMDGVNFNEEKVNINILKELTEFSSHQMEVGERIEFELAGKTNSLEPLAANSNAMTVVIELNGDTATFDIGEVRSLDLFDVKLSEMFVSNIGQESAVVTIDVWSD